MQSLDPNWVFPVGGTVSCGNRTDLPKKQRVHDWHDAGPDIRRKISDGSFHEVQVKICPRCGRDGEHRGDR